MPYTSDAQRKFMHAKHPEIAAKWDAEIRGKKKKIAKGWAKPIGIGVGASVLGGAAANQIPPVQKTEWYQERRRKKKKKGQIKKMLAPVSDDPFFNQEAAQKTFDLIMKMDDDTAAVFCYIVASDLLEREVEENRVTLQKHLDEVVAKRLTDLKKATLRAVSKGMENPQPYAQALAMIDSMISKADDDIPDWEFERKIKRDPSSGRFRTKFRSTPLKKPMPDKTAKTLGIAGITGDRYKNKMSPKEKARYQHQYLQIADFLGAVNAATDGDNETLVHFRNEATGETWAEKATSTKPMTTMLEENVWAVAAEAKPTTLSVGGAAFSLAGAAGKTMSADQVKAFNTAGEKSDEWKASWLTDDNGQNQNARLYQRTHTLGTVAQELGPDGSKVQLAGKMASIVGQYGPQAEEVLGPSARKTAYRYRGTERTPDERLIGMYSRAIDQNKRQGGLNPFEEQAENRIRTARGAKKQPFGSETGVRGKGSSRPMAQPGVTPAITQMVREREAAAGRAPDWRERELGRVAVQRYLMDELPSKKYYKLQLASGNTPPSEGVIINSEGQIVTQAVGYGDDHYLPFNLKNLKGLKGGEYIRNRSVGGLTAEDVYTGLISGARRVTVVSRSGTFTMEFKPDFRGGRRHNDKARRMTRRYEQVLDAVQSEQVERAPVPMRWRKMIEEEVKAEYGPTASPRLVRAEIDAREREFKANPQVNGRDMDRAEASISQFEEQQKRGLVSAQDVADYRKQIHSELRDLKEIHFRLNGVGYEAALDSLREQFPYYIDAQSHPTAENLEGEIQEHEMDMGYVEPGRNRPTSAQAGWFGTRKEESGKFSAAYSDYQRGLPGTPEPHGHPREKGKFKPTNVTSSTGSSGGGASVGLRSDRERTRDAAIEALQANQAKEGVISSAVALQQAVKVHKPPTGISTPEWWYHSEDQMREYLGNDANRKKFDTTVSQIGAADFDEAGASRPWQAYQTARKRTGGGKPYSPEHANTWPTEGPYKFTGDNERDAYRASPLPGAVDIEVKRLDGEDTSLKFGRPLSALNGRELREEFELSKNVREAMKTAKLQGTAAQDALGSQFQNSGSAFASNFFRDDAGAAKHLENIHRMHHLKSKSGGGTTGGGPVGGVGGFGRPTPPRPGGQAPSGARVQPPQGGGDSSGRFVELDPDDERLVEDARRKYLKAAEQLILNPESQEEHDALYMFKEGMKGSHPAKGFNEHTKWLEELPDKTRTKLYAQAGYS